MAQLTVPPSGLTQYTWVEVTATPAGGFWPLTRTRRLVPSRSTAQIVPFAPLSGGGPVQAVGVDRHPGRVVYAEAGDAALGAGAVQVGLLDRAITGVGPVQVGGVDRQPPRAVLVGTRTWGLVPSRFAWLIVPAPMSAQYRWLASTATPKEISGPLTIVCGLLPSRLARLIGPPSWVQ